MKQHQTIWFWPNSTSHSQSGEMHEWPGRNSVDELHTILSAWPFFAPIVEQPCPVFGGILAGCVSAAGTRYIFFNQCQDFLMKQEVKKKSFFPKMLRLHLHLHLHRNNVIIPIQGYNSHEWWCMPMNKFVSLVLIGVPQPAFVVGFGGSRCSWLDSFSRGRCSISEWLREKIRR